MRSIVLALVLASAGCKGDPDTCDRACRNYAQLVFWEEAEKEISAAPLAQRDELRKTKMAEFSRNLARGVDLCTSKCMSANNDEDTRCLVEAKTAAQAKACTTVER